MERSKFEELKKMISDWRICLDVPFGVAADFQLDQEEDKEINGLVEKHLEKIEEEEEEDFDSEDFVDEDEGEEDIDPIKWQKEMEKKRKKTPKSLIKHYEPNPNCYLGFYVFGNDLFVVSGGWDFPVSDLPDDVQEKIYLATKKKLGIS